jgi:hypothetical protein
VSIGARGLSGTSYRRHVFWDTDIFMLPFFGLSYPEAARARSLSLWTARRFASLRESRSIISVRTSLLRMDVLGSHRRRALPSRCRCGNPDRDRAIWVSRAICEEDAATIFVESLGRMNITRQSTTMRTQTSMARWNLAGSRISGVGRSGSSTIARSNFGFDQRLVNARQDVSAMARSRPWPTRLADIAYLVNTRFVCGEQPRFSKSHKTALIKGP